VKLKNQKVGRTYVWPTIILSILLVFNLAIAGDRSVTLAWDANTEENLAGYKIYYGKDSRITTSYGFMQKWCDEKEPTRLDKCLEEWRAICKDSEDQACHSMLFTYDTVVDVKNVTEYTLTGFNEGDHIYIAATAYNTENNESLFSIELTHRFDYGAPANPKGIIWITIPVVKIVESATGPLIIDGKIVE